MTVTERDRGATVIELPLAVGLLLIPVAIIVMVLPQWPESNPGCSHQRG